MRAVCVLSRVSRLLIDVNRPLHSPTLFRDIADGKPVMLNHQLTAAEKEKRIKNYYQPYHAALHSVISSKPIKLILSLHSYTQSYEGQKRDVEIGILHNRFPQLAQKINGSLVKLGYDSRVNEPWSGLDGFMFAVDSHITESRPGVMIEVRNDLLRQEVFRNTLCKQLVATLVEHKVY